MGRWGAGTATFCSRCFNKAVATLDGLHFEHVCFQPIDFLDAAGVSRRFDFVVWRLGDRVALEAFEVRGGQTVGSKFQIIDDPETDLFDLLQRLVEKMSLSLQRVHLEEGNLASR